MKNILTIILSLIVIGSFAQNGVVKGKIVDAQTNEPLPFVNIAVLGTQTGTASDLDGKFRDIWIKIGIRTPLMFFYWI